MISVLIWKKLWNRFSKFEILKFLANFLNFESGLRLFYGVIFSLGAI